MTIDAVRTQGLMILYRGHKPTLPVIGGAADPAWIQWGSWDSPTFARGSCVSLETLRGGMWKRYRPKPVRILVEAFLLERKAPGDQSAWIDVPSGAHIHGCLVESGIGDQLAQAVFIVTIPSPAEFSELSERWPKYI